MQPNPFTNPTAPGAPDPAPRPRDLEGCLVAYACREFTAAGAPGNEKGVGTGANASPPRDRVTVDVLVLDIPNQPRSPHQPVPGVVHFGGSPDWDQQPTPHYLQCGAPARFEGAWLSNQTMVRALAPNGQPLRNPDGTPQLLLGRIVRSTFGNRPFNLVSVDGTPDMARAIEIYNALGFGQVAYAQPSLIPGMQPPQRQQPQAPAGPQGGFPMPPQMQPNPAYAAATQYPQAQVSYGHPGAVAQGNGFVPQPDPGIAAVQAAFPGAQVVAPPPPPVPQPPAPAQTPLPGLPPHLVAQGWTPEHWAMMSPAQQAQVLANTPVQ